MAEHPTEESINITRKFLGGGQAAGGLPAQANPTAKKRTFGQQGSQQQQSPLQQDSLGDRFLDLPGPAGFASTPQGKAILQRILGSMGRRR